MYRFRSPFPVVVIVQNNDATLSYFPVEVLKRVHYRLIEVTVNPQNGNRATVITWQRIPEPARNNLNLRCSRFFHCPLCKAGIDLQALLFSYVGKLWSL